MRKIYFDYQLIALLMNKNDLKLESKISKLDDGASIFVYSPAHIEEIAVSRMRNNYPEQKIQEKLDFLSCFTNDFELLPFKRRDVAILESLGVFLCKEHPRECYKRVIDLYERNDVAEKIDEGVLEMATILNIFGNDPNEFNNTQPNLVLKNDKYVDIIYQSFARNMADNYHIGVDIDAIRSARFEDIKSDFQVFEALMNVIFNFLEVIRYNPEKVVKHRSRLHDVSHAIYAAYCDFFVSEDRKLREKTKVAYDFLEVKTQVTKLDEFPF